MIESKPIPTAREVREKLADWNKRIADLFRYVEDVAKRVPFEVLHGETPQVQEYLMRVHHIKPRRMPVLTLRNGRRELSFYPETLWIVGAEGRVDVQEGKRFHTLLDMGKGRIVHRDWQIVYGTSDGRLLPFDRREVTHLLARIQ